MLKGLAGKIISILFGYFVKPIIDRIFPSAEERLGEAEQANKDTKETENVKKKLDNVKPVSPDDTVKRLSDGSF